MILWLIILCMVASSTSTSAARGSAVVRLFRLAGSDASPVICDPLIEASSVREHAALLQASPPPWPPAPPPRPASPNSPVSSPLPPAMSPAITSPVPVSVTSSRLTSPSLPNTSSAPSPSPSSSLALPAGTVVGGVVGGVAILVASITCLIKRKRRQGTAVIDPPAPGEDCLLVLGTLTGPPDCTVVPSCCLPLVPPGGQLPTQEALLNQVRIDWASISTGRVLGKGGFGTVCQGVWQGSPVAVKMLNVERLSSQAREELRSEAFMMCSLRHPYIAQIYGLVDDNTHTALVMRYYRRGTVAAAIGKPEYMNLGMTQRLQMAQQVARGMCYLHEKKILHGDLKTSNLLVEDTAKRVVLADFGLACMAGQPVASGALTVSISPPEVLENPTAPRTPAGDVYAFSIVLMEIVTGLFMYYGMRSQQIKHVVCGGRRPTIPTSVPEAVASIVQACWAQEASSRPTFPEVIELLEVAASASASAEGDEQNEQGQGTTTRPTYTLSDLTT